MASLLSSAEGGIILQQTLDYGLSWYIALHRSFHIDTIRGEKLKMYQKFKPSEA
jgi:hypothetical protein